MCAACVAEPILASFGGGGFLLVRPAAGGPAAPVVFDFFGQTPKTRLPPDEIDFVPVEADFGSTRQAFHIGMGAVATPGVVKGLFAAHRALGRMPMREVVAPAVALARRGVETTPMQAYMARVVGAILKHTPESFALLVSPERPGELVQAGEVYRLPEVADLLEILAIEGEDLFYRGEIAARIALGCRRGGQLTMADLEGYRVEVRRPVEIEVLGARLFLNPPPSSGGILIAFALELLRDVLLARPARSCADFITTLARAMTATNRARVEARLHDLDEHEVAEAALAPQLLARYRREVLHGPQGRGGTTHISVVDRFGSAASLSISNGEGCGHVVPGTGIMLNNMLGEEDINPHGHHRWPADRRLASMMTPVIGLDRGGAVTALGSGGSNRIRTAILQVLVELFAFGSDLEAAVTAPRLHVEEDKLSIEPGFPEPVLEALARGFVLDRWAEKSMFFGGVHAARREERGSVSGAADERRDGAVIAV
jgi:gamma-glutamyltranspeptidase/glutathione hydrolase